MTARTVPGGILVPCSTAPLDITSPGHLQAHAFEIA